MKTFREFLSEDPDGTTRSVQLKKGMDKKKAWAAACKKPGSDFRGMKYNKDTGKATLV